YMLRQRAEFAGAVAAGQEALALATGLGDRDLQAQALHTLGQAYYTTGDYGQAAELFRRNVEALETGTGHPTPPYRISSQAWLVGALSITGQFAEGQLHGEEALRRATAEGRGSVPVLVHSWLGRLYLAQGDLE